MRTLSLLLCTLITAFIATPALAFECTNSGEAAAVAPDDGVDPDATACGPSAVASGTLSTALGYQASAVGAGGTALGYSADAIGGNSTALGYNPSSAGASSTALGHGASSGGEYSAALGYFVSSPGASSIALGQQATSGGNYSTALSYFASSAGASSAALGYSASSGGDSSVALGPVASSTGGNSMALGRSALAAGERSTALGFRAFASQPDTVILGSIAGANDSGTYAKVGIGTPTPVEAVDVERSAAAARFQLSSFTDASSEAPQFIQRRARGTSAAPTAVQSNDNLGLFSFRGHNGSSMGGSRATITAQAAGNFTGASTPTRLIFATTPVGQTTPQSVLVITPDGKLQVNGVNLNVPDYVFEDDYALMPLEELRAFIEENGHLPGIPSAEAVNSGGHDLAGSDMAQLRKIEELTLYTLQLQEQLVTQQEHSKAQESRLEAQQGRIDHLEALLTRALATID